MNSKKETATQVNFNLTQLFGFVLKAFKVKLSIEQIIDKCLSNSLKKQYFVQNYYILQVKRQKITFQFFFIIKTKLEMFSFFCLLLIHPTNTQPVIMSFDSSQIKQCHQHTSSKSSWMGGGGVLEVFWANFGLWLQANIV